MLFLFTVKCLGGFVYYWIYYVYYPGTFMCDTKSTMHDASVIYSALPSHPGDYLKMLFGIHTEVETDSLYKSYFHLMDKWHRREDFEFFLNDNRTMTRLNAFLMLFSFGQYPVHALCMVVISFAGQLLLYKTFRAFFENKLPFLLVVIFFAPSLFFWTSGVLKEPITLFLMGLFLYCFFEICIWQRAFFRHYVFIGLAVAMFLVMKPYVFVLLLIPLLIYTVVYHRNIKRVGLFYAFSFFLLMGISWAGLKFLMHKDVIATIVRRQNDFVNLSYGGRFMLNKEKYVRFEYADSNMLQKVSDTPLMYRFKPHARYMYWNLDAINDTVYVQDNTDTSLYQGLSIIAPAGSGIYFERLDYSVSSVLKMVPYAYRNLFLVPLFAPGESPTELFASVENVLILLFIALGCVFMAWAPEKKNLFWFLLYVVLSAFLLIGLTTTVSGAIVRYKALFLPFLLMIPLLLMKDSVLQKIPFLKRLLNGQ
ncbi:MAG: hypothetical protein JST26_03575 [Bacteroidetes bacterium]|nr:hypothetical protein [Bacteroidota bacterium]